MSVTLSGFVYSQDTAHYILNINDGAMLAPNQFEFDIDMTWTNSDTVSNFEYAGAQFFLNFNAGIANGGTMIYAWTNISDLPVNMRPRSPTVYTLTTPAQLRLAVNTFPGAGSGFLMPPDTTVRIIRMRLTTTASSFAQVPFELQWRNALPNPFTKIFQYVGTTNTDITRPSKHSISLLGFFETIPYTITTKLGIEGLMNNNSHLKRDSVKIYIISTISPYQKIDSGKSVLDSVTLTASFVTTAPAGNYYIVIKHRNSLETWSKVGGEPLGNGNYFYDFTTSASQAYGNNLILRGSTYCIYSGNINGDDIIDAEDLIYVDNDVFNYAPGTNITNLNGDQIVDIEDLAICEKNARALRIVQWPGSAFTRNSRSVRDIFTGNSRIIINP